MFLAALRTGVKEVPATLKQGRAEPFLRPTVRDSDYMVHAIMQSSSISMVAYD